MALMELTSLKGKEVISQDAYLVGEIVDIRCDSSTWAVQGLKLKTGKAISDKLNAGFGKSMILFAPGNYKVKDVLLFPDEFDSARSRVVADSNGFLSLLSVIGMKVLSDEDVIIGTVDEVMVDIEDWSAASIKVKLNKESHEPLGVKKGLIGSKVVSGILTSDIDVIDAGQIKLGLSIKELRNQITVD